MFEEVDNDISRGLDKIGSLPWFLRQPLVALVAIVIIPLAFPVFFPIWLIGRRTRPPVQTQPLSAVVDEEDVMKIPTPPLRLKPMGNSPDWWCLWPYVVLYIVGIVTIIMVATTR